MESQVGNYNREITLSLDTWVKLARAHTVVFNLANENVRSFGLTMPQFGVIEALGHLGPMRIGKLCDKMLVSGGNMTLVLDNLEKNNYIERAFNKEDRRAINIQLTEKGKELFDKIFIEHANFLKDKFSVLNETELTQLGSLLKKLGLALSKK